MTLHSAILISGVIIMVSMSIVLTALAILWYKTRVK